MSGPLLAGVAAINITPHDSQFLFGYPHVERWSEGVHHPLYASALYLTDGATELLTVASDVLFVDRNTAQRARSRIEQATGVPAANIVLTATHTHSGPVTTSMLCSADDPVVPDPDEAYVRLVEDGIVEAAFSAIRNPFAAELALVVADGACVGTNRHDPTGPNDPDVPVLAVRDRERDTLAALMLVCSMHPTVLHEDSRLVSSDFPGAARAYLQEHVLGPETPVIYHTGVSGDQSPRHITRANTTDEADRIGALLGKAVQDALRDASFTHAAPLACTRCTVHLPLRLFPAIDEAEASVLRVRAELERLRRGNADKRDVRTVECQLFGAEETLTFSRAQAAGLVEEVTQAVSPAEITLFCIGPWSFLFWPGEVFVEFGLEVRSEHPDCFIVTMANGELQGYLVTEQAVRNETYEALNAIFASPESGRLLVDRSLQLLSEDLGATPT